MRMKQVHIAGYLKQSKRDGGRYIRSGLSIRTSDLPLSLYTTGVFPLKKDKVLGSKTRPAESPHLTDARCGIEIQFRH
jgi:hypothetical protein